MELVSLNVIFETLSDDKTLVLLDTTALSGSDMDTPISKLGITRKQYYSRTCILTNSGLITRQKGKYYLTSLGKIVSFYQFRIGRALNNFWKLKALDTLSNEATNDPRLKHVYLDLVNNLIDDVKIREILTRPGTSSLSAKSNVHRDTAEQPSQRVTGVAAIQLSLSSLITADSAL
ncbi:MAG: hypothetical protein DLM72_08900 [Candidatus Nitrosopolaris wilkensis]|nr:MAG: hypothetical protein DLM72_08900 [Candidatus Nitrosopolaris wilkensis]